MKEKREENTRHKSYRGVFETHMKEIIKRSLKTQK